MAFLRIKNGAKAGESYALGTKAVAGGRGTTCDIQLPDDAKISRRHFTVARQDADTCVIRCEPEAKNGLWINGNELRESVLRNRDVVRVGDTELEFLAADDPAQIDAVRRMHELSRRTARPTVGES